MGNYSNEYLNKIKKYFTDSEEIPSTATSTYISNDLQSCLTACAEIATGTTNNKPEIEKVIFNKPATIVIWKDKTKTVVKCGENDIYDPEKGLAMCYVKKILGNKGNYYNTIKKWLPNE